MKTILFSFLFFLTSCASSPKTPSEIPMLVEVSPEVSPFFMRQKITVFTKDETRELDAVVQYDGSEIITVFLDPTGRAGVMLVQRGTDAKISGRWVDKIPFDLRWVMQVIGATFALSPIQQETKGTLSRQTRIGLVEDIWDGSRITHRKIVQSGTSIEYKWDDSLCPAEIIIENTKRAYKLSIKTTACEEMQ